MKIERYECSACGGRECTVSTYAGKPNCCYGAVARAVPKWILTESSSGGDPGSESIGVTCRVDSRETAFVECGICGGSVYQVDTVFDRSRRRFCCKKHYKKWEQTGK